MKLLLKILLGVLTLTPILIILVYVLLFLVDDTAYDPHIPYRIRRYFDVAIFWMTPALVLIYAVILARTDKLKTDTKILWAVLFLIGHIITMPVFFFVNIWKERTVAKEVTD